MKLLLDENLPKRLKLLFPNHQVFTVREKQWNGIKNGNLLSLMLNENFDALLTFDKNMQHQQNFSKYSIAVFVLSGAINTYEEMRKLVPKIESYLTSPPLPSGIIEIR
jgi:predicted nuclease of predicted toxin-antitoxin system